MSRLSRCFWIAATTAAICLISGAATRADGESADRQLEQLFDDAWEFTLKEDPLQATSVGDARYNDLLPQETLADQQRRRQTLAGFLERLAKIDRKQLSAEQQVNYDVYRKITQDQLAEYEFNSHLTPITNRSGFHISFPDLPKEVPLRDVKDYENYIARLKAFDRYAQQHIALMREGMRQGYTLPAVVLRGFQAPLEAQIVADPTTSLLYAPFDNFPAKIDASDRQRLAEAGKLAIQSSVVPGYEKFLKFMQDVYVPAARTQIAASALPQGRAFYRHRVRRFTTLGVSPQEVHDVGMAEVQRIRKEMEEVIKQAGFKGDRPAFVKFLRSSEQFQPKTAHELMTEVALVLKRMDGELPTLFKTLPRTPYGILPVPDFIAPQTTTAYYSPPPGNGLKAGFYYVNTYNLKSRPLYEIEALSLHEAVPGHHLQIALQQEMASLPNFRRFSNITAFIEGWGLYAERLGLEVGFYQDPYSNFGRLSYEMWRACRLVVDTGMHYLGWSRRQAIDFMAENTALSLHNITTEVDRYISWPGQALAYKMGELTIRGLRKRAEQTLGQRFDVREFHDVVLGSGAVPLEVLESNVDAYLRR